MRRSRRRGEGYTEYAVITLLIMICSVVGLLRAGSTAIESVANSKALCSNCPDARLSTDEISKLREAIRTPSDTRSPTDVTTIRDLGERHRRYLEELKRSGTTWTDADDKELSELDTALANLPPPPVVDPIPTTQPSFWERLFGGPIAADSFLASLMGIFGWFGFFV